MLGCGSIGQAVLPLLVRDMGVPPRRITVVTADRRGEDIARALGVTFVVAPLDPANYREVLGSVLRPGGFLLNLTVGVSSLELLEFASRRGARYLDTGIEPWPGGYTDSRLSPAERSNQALRAKALTLARKLGPGTPTAVICQGANPGLVSQLAKAGVLAMAEATGGRPKPPRSAAGWAALFRSLGIRTIQIAEHDSQVGGTPKAAGEFVATWSVDGFVGKARSRPSSAGARARVRCHPMAAGPRGMGRASTCCGRAWTSASAAGRPRPGRSWAT